MRIAVVYLRVIKQNDPGFPHRDWERSARRFLDTYQRFKPSIPHDLIIVNRGTPDHDGLFDSVATRYIYSTSTGYDITRAALSTGGRLKANSYQSAW